MNKHMILLVATVTVLVFSSSASAAIHPDVEKRILLEEQAKAEIVVEGNIIERTFVAEDGYLFTDYDNPADQSYSGAVHYRLAVSQVHRGQELFSDISTVTMKVTCATKEVVVEISRGECLKQAPRVGATKKLYLVSDKGAYREAGFYGEDVVSINDDSPLPRADSVIALWAKNNTLLAVASSFLLGIILSGLTVFTVLSRKYRHKLEAPAQPIS